MRRWITTIFVLIAGPGLAAADAHADNAWETMIEGTGTPFEKRWAATDPLADESSAGTMLGYAGIGVDDDDLYLYINHPYPVIDTMLSAMAGEELECKYDNWRLAVDQREFTIADSSKSTDNDATSLNPIKAKAFWQAFVDGSVLGAQVEQTCNGDTDVVTMVYSLAGSQAAVEFVLGKVPVLAQESKEADGVLQAPDSNEIAAYQSAISQKIERNWSAPASAGAELECSVRVRQVPGGEVVGVTILSCNGDEAVRRSVEAAIYRSSPLPEPSDPSLFDQNIELNLSIK